MKIGIVTFHRVPNYGAMLQAFALQTCLQNRGHEVIFLPVSLSRAEKFSLIEVLSSRNWASARKKLQRNRDMLFVAEFADSRLNLALPHCQSCPTQDFPTCDAYLVGSDQMWNPRWSAAYLREMLLDFAPPHAKKIAFAVSFGTSQWGVDFRDEMRRMLNGFEAISVRERDGVALVRELADVEAAWLPDPTLLFDAAFYAQLAPSRNDTRRRSLFKYFIGGETDALRSFDELLKKELALDEISSDARWAKGWLGRSLRLNDRLHVSQWLGRMRDCTCVVTNSFHGTVFAIINRKPFVTFLQSGPAAAMNNRLVSLLHRLSLSDRLLPCINQTVLCDLLTRKIEWGEVSQRIAEWQHESDRFLAAAEL